MLMRKGCDKKKKLERKKGSGCQVDLLEKEKGRVAPEEKRECQKVTKLVIV
jgi:hypothetical protein